MSAHDVFLVKYVLPVVYFIIACFVLHALFKERIKWVQQRIYAIIMSRLAISYNKWTDKRKKKLFASLHDLALQKEQPVRVLEVGAGSGANFKYFPDGTELVCVEPNPAFRSYLDASSEEFSHVTFKAFIEGSGEYMPEVEDSSVDAVVCTLVMCSVQSVHLCLKEIKRVLKPGCSFYFLDHVRGKEKSMTYVLQRVVEPLWKRLADNCHVTRQPWKSMVEEGFIVDYELFDGTLGNRLLLPWKPHCIGTATKPE